MARTTWETAPLVSIPPTDEDVRYAWSHAFAWAEAHGGADTDTAAAYASWYVDAYYRADDDVLSAPGHPSAFRTFEVSR